MTQLVIEDIEPTLIAKLEHLAQRNDRSLQEELKSILRQAAKNEPYQTGGDWEKFKGMLEESRKKHKGRPLTDSTELLREDRGW